MKTKKEFRQYLNTINNPSVDPHKNGKFGQIKRGYGDYLYYQDRNKFNADYLDWCEAIRQKNGGNG